MTVKINYGKTNNYFKQIFSLDDKSGFLTPLSTKDVPEKKYATATTTAVSGKLIILAKSDILTVGTASWYNYKKGLFAASPDFGKGSILRVTNLANGKYVDVTINDFGPERTKHPDRVVDLDKVAFQKIASISAGVIKIKVDPLKIVTPIITKFKPVLFPTISASSAIIIKESDGKMIWGKNEKKIAPLASLTKLIAIRVFLDTRPTLNKVVSYKVQDENYNYKYCKPQEAAKLTVKDGDTLTIEDLLYSALVGSANNAVESLVRVSGLDRDDFIEKMNKIVKSWGATSTHFVEPTGLSPQNVSSPFDYAIIAKEIFKNPLIQKISTTPKYSFTTINTKKAHTVKNTDKLLFSSQYPIIGSKTGYLNEAGNCLMTRIKTAQGNLIVVNFGSKSNANSFADNEQLIKYGLRQSKK
jgi:D-alanyl-D-alanine endopeptidase (penicillin-binding protein 7)